MPAQPVIQIPRIGDIIRSRQFACGYWSEGHTWIYVDGVTRSLPLLDGSDRGAYDESRGSALFLVEAMTLNEPPPKYTWTVTARRIPQDRPLYSLPSEIIVFNILEAVPKIDLCQIEFENGRTDLAETRSYKLRKCREHFLKTFREGHQDAPTIFDLAVLAAFDSLTSEYGTRRFPYV